MHMHWYVDTFFSIHIFFLHFHSDTINNSEIFYFDIYTNNGSIDVYLPSASIVGEGFTIHLARTYNYQATTHFVNVYPKQGSSDTIPWWLPSTGTPLLQLQGSVDNATLVSDGVDTWIVIGHHSV